MEFSIYEERNGEPVVSLVLNANEMMSIHAALFAATRSHLEWLMDNKGKDEHRNAKMEVFLDKAELLGGIAAVSCNLWEKFELWLDEDPVCDTCIEEMIEEETKKGNGKK